jgi:hypothetical protein
VTGIAAVCVLIATAAFIRALWLDIRNGTLFRSEGSAHGWWLIAFTGEMVYWSVAGPAWLAGLNALFAVVQAWLWRNDRRKRKRTLAALGNKARALIASMVKRAREAAKPRPVLRPLPQPAGSPA